ncbi:hypothetical protein M427DRAFT_52540 [Gonapodya prolifera JEL478]|uniref:Uncharacterized protein n=1 Tax=Gonapodya prolifera (strain JEL478) TaxID=1344416 RepID=A0A139AUD1_GONPJ|nr:hypothetical protein M427DRAFT_52540 [Gonapodya prolifera JEL478]|eukprot:KXS20317.1 hypothetical protein M427DRAFT_52540 [Gonapodya prolifera JEL478]
MNSLSYQGRNQSPEWLRSGRPPLSPTHPPQPAHHRPSAEKRRKAEEMLTLRNLAPTEDEWNSPLVFANHVNRILGVFLAHQLGPDEDPSFLRLLPDIEPATGLFPCSRCQKACAPWSFPRPSLFKILNADLDSKATLVKELVCLDCAPDAGTEKQEGPTRPDLEILAAAFLGDDSDEFEI